MQEIIARQNSAAKPLTGKQFLLSVASIILRLAIAQLLANLLITLTGVGLLNVLFYLYAVWLLVGFMGRTVAGNIYTLKESTLVLQRMLGDTTITLVEIPTDSIVSIRPVCCGENLGIDYRQVTYIDPARKPSARLRAAFLLSLIWAGAARLFAGKAADRENGMVVVYDEGGIRRACVFTPDDEFRTALYAALTPVYGEDERVFRPKLKGYYARSLCRAFPALYPQVLALVSQGDLDWAQEEIQARRAARFEEAVRRNAHKENISLEKSRAQLLAQQREKEETARKAAELAKKGAQALKDLPEKAVQAVNRLREGAPEEDFIPEDEAQAEADAADDGLCGDLYVEPREAAQPEENAAPRRRRSRQE